VIRRIAIVGGTHGNELTGVALVRDLEARPRITDGLEVRTLIGNPGAVEQCRRFVDRDLNRAFRPSELANPTLSDHESRRAREVAAELRPDGEPAVDFIVDLHTTTSNMGVSLLLASSHPLELQLCAAIMARVPSRVLLLGGLWGSELPYLKTLAPHSLAIEVGPIPQGVLRHDILEQTRAAVEATLAHFSRLAVTGTPPADSTTLAAFEAIENVAYPLDAAGRPLVVHRDLQDRDWQPLEADQPLFVAADGTEQKCLPEWVGLCPVFINEAAYYPDTAFVLTRQVELPIGSSD
jgi:succinylglutamate desuccinylase